MVAQAMIMPKKYFFDANGDPLAFGKVYTYETLTTTDKVSYTTETADVENTNPVILNSEGYATIYLKGTYAIVVDDADDNNIWTEDPVSSNVIEEWVNCETPTYISTTSFSIVGDVTNEYEPKRRVQIDNDVPTLVYSTILTASFGAGITTIVVKDAVVAAGIIGVCVSIIGPNSLAANRTLNYKTLADAVADVVSMKVGDGIFIEERETGKGGGSHWSAVDATTVTENEANIVTGDASISLVLVVTKEVFTSQFGIVGTSDDTVKFQIAADYAVANNKTFVQDNTAIVDGVVMTGDIDWRGINSAKLTHKLSAVSVAVKTVGNTEIQSVEVDGNQSNQTNRLTMIEHTGDDFSMYLCDVHDTIKESVNVVSADIVNIYGNDVHDIAEHSGVLGENTAVFRIDSSIDIARCHVSNNFFVNPIPSNTAHAPVAIVMDTGDAKCGDTVITGNTIVNFGRSFVGNQEACIEIYKNCDRAVVSNNIITKYHYSGIRISDSQDIIVHHNIVVGEGSDIGAGESAIAVLSLTHDVTTKFDFIVDHNIVECATRGGIYVAGGGVGNELHNAIVEANDVRLAGESSLHLSFLDGDIQILSNFLKNATDHNILIDNAAGSLKISGGVLKNASNSGIFCRDFVSSLDACLDGVTVDTAATFGYTFRGLNSLDVKNCKYIGTAPTSNDFDSDVATGIIIGNSWQETTITKIASYPLAISDNGKTYNNIGTAVTVQFDLPIITSIPDTYTAKFIVSELFQVQINPNNADQVLRITDAAGDKVVNTGILGSHIKFSIDNGDWIAEEFGTWTDGN